MTPSDTDIKVPLVVGPGVAKQAVMQITQNVALCPTFTDLAGQTGPTQPDGHSLVPLLRALGRVGRTP
jgi:arylsulfatase A-like enzyme